jgi:DNA-binding winged helix-turn-helix (wHTH) protein
MDALTGSDRFLFEGFRLDRQARALCRRDPGGEFVPIAIGSRALEVLDVLVGRAGDLVSRDEFMAAVRPATAVEDTNLNCRLRRSAGSSTRAERGEAASRLSPGAATASGSP